MMTHPLGASLDRSIVLVGQMGAGKSTIGRRLATRLGLPFVDSDDAIRDASGYTPAEIFERFGEAAFRDGERRLVARLIEEGDVQVIATGGGAYIDPETRALLNDRAHTVWLDADLDLLAKRTWRPDNRPMLSGTLEERRARLCALEAERRPYYSEAHCHVRSRSAAHRHVVDAVVAAIEDRLATS